ncbi:MAG: hypothetical protein QM803_17530 [Rhodocyclaceae bacterium]
MHSKIKRVAIVAAVMAAALAVSAVQALTYSRDGEVLTVGGELNSRIEINCSSTF